jgi:hypothetical protein
MYSCMLWAIVVVAIILVVVVVNTAQTYVIT